MGRTLTILAAALSALFIGSVAHAYDDLELNSFQYEGIQRTVGVYVPPSYHSGTPAPLIVALHGRFSSARAFHALSHLRRVADARGAIVIYPQASEAFWNDGGLAALARADVPRDDAGFIASAIDAIDADYTIDRAQVFITGYDSGAALAYRLACNGQLQLAGVAAVSALMWDYISTTCASAPPTPMLILHGRRDDLYPVNGGEVNQGQRVRRLSADQTVNHWRQVNGCAQATENRGDSSYFATCTGAPVAYIEVPGGEHDWFRTGANYELNRQDIDTAATIDTFFFDRTHFALPTPRGANGRARAMLMYAPPSYDPATPTPLVVVLHGRPQNATGIAQDTQWNAAAARHGFLVAYPEGINNEWNAFNDLTGRRSVTPQNDQEYLETLVRDLAIDFNIDPRRVYLTGFSNGGFMTIRMACTSSNTFAGYAAVGAGLYSVLTGRCRSRRAPFLLMHGTGDESVAYNGVIQADGRGGEPTRISLGAQDTVAFFIRRNGCSLTGESAIIAESGRSPGTRVVRFAPRGCADGADVLFYLINGGAHNWPGLPNSGPEPINMDINATEVIWDFFQQHTLPEAPAR
ncbi:MAG: PHB depolymerase family esterase [Terricaulis sp.]